MAYICCTYVSIRNQGIEKSCGASHAHAISLDYSNVVDNYLLTSTLAFSGYSIARNQGILLSLFFFPHLLNQAPFQAIGLPTYPISP